jgi:hypothetical protein
LRSARAPSASVVLGGLVASLGDVVVPVLLLSGVVIVPGLVVVPVDEGSLLWFVPGWVVVLLGGVVLGCMVVSAGGVVLPGCCASAGLVPLLPPGLPPGAPLCCAWDQPAKATTITPAATANGLNSLVIFSLHCD